MLVDCAICKKCLDDEFRDTSCPHNTFLANDGQNNFKHYPESWLADHAPRRGFSDPKWVAGADKSEHDQYQEWLNKNKVKSNGH